MNTLIRYSVNNERDFHKLTFQLNYTRISDMDYTLSLIPSAYDNYYQFPDGLYEHIITEIKKQLETLILTVNTNHKTNTEWLDINHGLMLQGSNKRYTIWYNKTLKNVFMNVYF